MEIHILENIDHRRLQMAGQGKGAVMLGVTTDLEHFLAQLGERRREVGRGRRFPDPAFAVNRENLRALDLHRRVEMHLQRSLAIFALAQHRGCAEIALGQTCGLAHRGTGSGG